MRTLQRLCLLATLRLHAPARLPRPWQQRFADAFPTTLALARHTHRGLGLWAPLVRNRRVRRAAAWTLLLLACSRIGEFVLLPGLDLTAWRNAVLR